MRGKTVRDAQVANAHRNMDGNSPFCSTSMRPAVAFQRLVLVVGFTDECIRADTADACEKLIGDSHCDKVDAWSSLQQSTQTRRHLGSCNMSVCADVCPLSFLTHINHV